MTRRLTWLVIALTAIAAGLTGLDRFLARVESAELHGTAQRAYVSGSSLLNVGKAAAAIDPLREAHSIERQNPDYALALITALTNAGKTAEAELLMQEMLAREPNDGRVNLTAARLAVREGNAADAEAYFHRAIYGEWQDDPAGHRIAARMELIDDLTARGRKQELLAELIAIEAEPTATPAIRKRLARLFSLAGSPARAVDVYRQITAKDPRDIDAWAGLGEAELEQGQYDAARAAFLQGFLRNPNDVSIRSHLQTLNTVAGLDPTLRKLTSQEKYSRSVRILEMARAGLAACVEKKPEADNSLKLLPAAASVIGKAPAHVTNEAAESVLALAEAVWRARNEACNANSSEEDALNLLMKKLAS
jgi:tetratricopeptide (TPR) repeat protein